VRPKISHLFEAFKMVRAQPLSRQVYEHLLRRIFSGELAPGTMLRESELAAKLGVSRTPIREALGRLAEYGVVESRPNHGAVVRRMGRDELIHLHQAREALEAMAIELACGKLTDADFARLDALAEAARDPASPDYLNAADELDVSLHQLIAERSGNPILAREIRKLHDMTMLIHDQFETVLIDGQRIDRYEKRELREIGWREHVEIIAALKAGKPEDCRAAMVAHIRSASQYKARLFAAPEPGRDGDGKSGPS
jgi:DNA-binding GntR family transcriptional regulator